MDFVSVKNDTDKVELGMMSIVRSHRQRPYWYMLNHIQKVKTGETAVDVCLCCVTCVCVCVSAKACQLTSRILQTALQLSSSRGCSLQGVGLGLVAALRRKRPAVKNTQVFNETPCTPLTVALTPYCSSLFNYQQAHTPAAVVLMNGC